MLLLSKILLEKKEYSMFIERFLGALSMEKISPIFVDNGCERNINENRDF